MKPDKLLDQGLKREPGGNWSLAAITLALCVVAACMVALWHFANRNWLGPTFNADINFLLAPDRAPPRTASRFVVRVEQDKNRRPLPGRVVDVVVTPKDMAQIVSVSGASGTNYAKQDSRAKGRTDSAGNLDIVVSAKSPGKYTIVATDSTSLKSAVAEFRVEGS
jgi:hypothetical protein